MSEKTFEQVATEQIEKAVEVGRAMGVRQAQMTMVSRDTFSAATNRIEKLEAVLREIVAEYDATYDGDQDSNGHWTAAASIPLEVMARAAALLK